MCIGEEMLDVCGMHDDEEHNNKKYFSRKTLSRVHVAGEEKKALKVLIEQFKFEKIMSFEIS